MSDDPLLASFANLIIGEENMNQELSILETLLDKLSCYFQVVKQDPWLLPKPEKAVARQVAVQQGVLTALAKLLKPLQTQIKIRRR